MENKKKSKKGFVIIGTIIAMAGLIVIPTLLAIDDESKTPINEKVGIPLFSVKTAKVEKQTLRSYLETNGDIVSAQQTDVFPDASGKLLRVNVTLGSRVYKGEVIAEIDPSRPGATYMNSPVYAPISGIVSRTPLSAGATVSPAISITAVSVIDNLEIVTQIPEREIADLSTGLKAEVTLQAYPGEIFTATVTHVSPILDAASRSKLITLKFDRNDSRINAGMFVRIRLNTRTYRDVLVVPVEAVVNKHGVNVIYTTRNNEIETTVEQRAITTGVTLQGWTEIKAGLFEGETIIVQGQQLLNDGIPVRVAIGGIE